MTAPESPPVKKFDVTPLTTQELEWTDLEVVDLSKMDTPEGRDQLVNTVRQVMSTRGFFLLVGHGFEQSQTDRAHDIGDLPFSEFPEKDRAKFEANIKKTGSLEGYRLKDPSNNGNGIGDQTELYNIYRDVKRKDHPDVLTPYLPDIQEFVNVNHSALDKVFKLLSLGLELPEDTLSNLHKFDAVNETYLTYFKFQTRFQSDDEKAKDASLKGHKDSGTITFLWSQSISTLQILEPDGHWTYVKHIPNSIVVNAGDMLEILSGGYYKAAVHRVTQPPADQLGRSGLGILYYGLADNDFKLVPFADSPLLKRVGVKHRYEAKDAPTALKYWQGRNGG